MEFGGFIRAIIGYRWVSQVSFGVFWYRRVSFGIFGYHLVYFGISVCFLVYFGISGCFLVYFGIFGYHWVYSGISRYNWVSLDFLGYLRVLLCEIGYYWLLGIFGYPLVLVSLGIFEYFWVSLIILCSVLDELLPQLHSRSLITADLTRTNLHWSLEIRKKHMKNHIFVFFKKIHSIFSFYSFS